METQNRWKDILTSLPTDVSIIDKEDIENVASMLSNDEVNLQKFLSNMEAFIVGPNFKDLALFRGQNIEISMTPSMEFFSGRPDRKASGIPTWFYIAYPDVMKWYQEIREEIRNKNGGYEKSFTIEISQLFGINIQDPSLEIENITNSKGESKPEHLKNLVENFKIKTNKKLEVQ